VLNKFPNDVKVVFKNFPLRSHKFAEAAALAALAADRQGKFWQMHDKIFENYNKLSDDKLKSFASEIGLNMAQFEADKADQQLFRQVQADLKNGVDAGVRGTPTIFVNGRRLKNRSMAGFEAAINAQLKNK